MSSKTIYDKHGNRIGEDVITTDRDGRVHIAHYDDHNTLVGRSYETTDHRGEVYMIHEDARGNRLARSAVERDWWGDYYVKTEQTRFAREQAEAERKKKQEYDIGENNADGSAGIVGDALYGIVMFVLKIFGILFIGTFLLQFVFVAGCTIWPFVLMPILNKSDNLHAIGPAFILLTGLLEMTFWPYAGILLYRRWKKKITWKDFFFAVLRWAIIGPFAYRKLVQMKQEKLPHPGYIPVHKEKEVFCRGCGFVADSNDRFCKKCGTDLRKTSETQHDHFPIPGKDS